MLAGDAPTVKVNAAYSKHRRDDIQPIDAGLADTLAAWLKGKPDTGRVLEVPGRKQRRERLADDFLCPVDGEGRMVDFHALRHCYISRVVQSGVSVKVAMELARHSTPTLTLGRYAHVRMADLRQGVPTVPTGTKPQTQSQVAVMRATGTDDAIQLHKSATRAQHSGRDVMQLYASGCNAAGGLKLAGGAYDTPVIAADCDKMQTDANMYKIPGGGIRTHDQGIMSPRL